MGGGDRVRIVSAGRQELEQGPDCVGIVSNLAYDVEGIHPGNARARGDDGDGAGIRELVMVCVSVSLG